MPRHKRRIIIPEVIEIAASLQRTNVRRGTRKKLSMPDRAYTSMLNWDILEFEPLHARVKSSNRKSESQSLDDKLSKFKFLVGGSNESSH